MRIQKIGHACLLVEESGRRLLIDPGSWAFAPIGAVEPEAIGPVDTILITHEHPDHFAPEILKRITMARQPAIVSHARIAELLMKGGMPCGIIAAGGETEVAGFRIRGVAGAHGEVLGPVPQNLGYLVNETLFHPGDSITFEPVPCVVYAMPLAAPWLRLVDSARAAAALRPRTVIPIHDAHVRDFFLGRMHAMVKVYLEAKGTKVILDKLEY